MRKTVLALTSIFIAAALLTACGGGGSSADGTATSGAVKDVIAPTVTYMTPATGAAGVAIDSSVTVTFSEAIDPASINQQTFTVSGVQGVVTYEPTSKTAMFTHPPMSTNSTYTVTITKGVKDQAGNSMGSAYTWTFVTSSSTDTVAPAVISVAPMALNVPVNSAITAAFSEPMDISTVNSAFTVRETITAASVAGSTEYIGGAVTFTPSVVLKGNTAYTANIATTASDLAGNRLSATNSSWSFTTSSLRDEIAPKVIVGSEIPANASTNAPVTSPISIMFDEPIYPFLFGAINGIPGTVLFDYTNNRVTMTPSQSLTPGFTYTGYVHAADLAGNPMAEPYTWSFTVQRPL